MPDDAVVGEIDGAWKQADVGAGLRAQRPERLLETFYVLTELVRVRREADTRGAEGIGRPVAQAHALCACRRRWPGRRHAGKEPVVEAVIVKDVGTIGGRSCRTRRAIRRLRSAGVANRATFEERFDLCHHVPPADHQGPTTILRGIIARGLGLRNGGAVSHASLQKRRYASSRRGVAQRSMAMSRRWTTCWTPSDWIIEWRGGHESDVLQVCATRMGYKHMTREREGDRAHRSRSPPAAIDFVADPEKRRQQRAGGCDEHQCRPYCVQLIAAAT